MCYRQSRRGVSRRNSEKCKTIVCIANTLTHRSFYTQTRLPHKSFYTQKLLHTEAFTHKSFHTQKLLQTDTFTHRPFYTQALVHTKAFTHRSFYIQKLLHTDAFTQTLLHTGAAFTHKRFDTQKLLHIDAFTHRQFYTQTLLQTNTFTQTLLHADACTHRSFYTQTLLHTDGFTYKHFYAETLLHTDAFTHRRLYTQALLHTITCTQTLLHTGRPMYSQRSHRCRGHLSNPTGWCGEVLFPCDSKPACINMSWGLCALGPSTKVVCHLKKKSKRADLAGGERFWAGTRTVLQYDRRKFRSQTSDNMDRWKAEQGRGREKRKIRRKKSRRERLRRKKMQMREKVGKSRFTVFFQWFGAPEGRKVGSLKRRVRSQLARWEMKKCTPLWREAHFEVKSVKNWRSQTTFGSWDVEKVHAVVARSTFPSQNVQNTSTPDHFWKLRCRKSARRCGAKHISKSKCTKHLRFGPLLEVEMSKSARRCGAKHISKSKV